MKKSGSDRQSSNVNLELDNALVLGKIKPLTGCESDNLKLVTSITQSINQGLRNTANEMSENIDAFLEGNQFIEAYEFAISHAFFVPYVGNDRIIDSLSRLLDSNLGISEKFHLFGLITQLMFFFDKKDSVIDFVDNVFDNYNAHLDEATRHHLLIQKAEAYRGGVDSDSAVIIYRQVIDETKDNSRKAYCYRGLALSSEFEKDKNLTMAADFFETIGNFKEQIKCLVLLSDFQYKNDFKKSLNTLDKAEIILSSTPGIMREEYYAALLHKKSHILLVLREYQLAFECIEKCCSIRKFLIGAEKKYFSSLLLAEELSRRLDDLDIAEKYSNEASLIASSINDEDFFLHQSILSAMEDGYVPSKEIISRVNDSKDKDLISNSLIAIALYSDKTLPDKLHYLKKAIKISQEKSKVNHIYNVIAHLYKDEGLYDEALQAYKISLAIEPYDLNTYQECCSMLQYLERWEELIVILTNAEGLIGHRKNICFVLARAFFEKGDYYEALKYFNRIKDEPSFETGLISGYIIDCAVNINSDSAMVDRRVAKNEMNSSTGAITLDEMRTAIKDFSYSISSDSRMHFWQYNKETKEYKWTSNPEEVSKQLFISFMNGRFGKKTIDIIQETTAGSGFIDLYLVLRGGLKIVIELKMCGARYSSTYAMSGYEQVIHYLDNKETKVGFLVVFDARIRDFSKGFEAHIFDSKYNIYTEVVDVRSSFKTRS